MVCEADFTMSDKKKSFTKMEKQDTPSTTKFFEDEEVFVQNNDQFILGKIKEIDIAAEKCLVNIDGGETLWASFKDLTPWAIDIDESSIKCNVCKSSRSKKSNIVVACEICFRGYHQKCHQPIIESAQANWICKKCRKKQNCQAVENIVIQKTASSTSKDISLPQSHSDINCNGKKKNCTSHSTHTGANSFKGQKVCIKSASPSYSADEQRRTTSKVKKKNRPVDNKTCTNSTNDAQLTDLPPTPPSSISAPETPQPTIVNGELPVSPTREVSCMDFNDSSPTYLATCRLEELFADSKEPPSNITLPLQLNAVIVEPVIRPTKRILSEKDFKITANGGVVVKRRHRFRRLSSVGIRPIDPAKPSTSQLNNKNGIMHSVPRTPVKTLSSESPADLKTLVYSYFDFENKQLGEGARKFEGLGLSEEYRICGKRKTLDGRVQYLIEWVKCTDPL